MTECCDTNIMPSSKVVALEDSAVQTNVSGVNGGSVNNGASLPNGNDADILDSSKMGVEYFGLRFIFDHETIDNIIHQCIKEKKVGYVCALDGNNFSHSQRLPEHLKVLNSSIVNNCDSVWVPKTINWIYGTNYRNYCASDLFFKFVGMRRYKQFFLGSSKRVLSGLKNQMKNIDPAIVDMRFEELPYCNLEDFDYKSIAAMINEDAPDIIWISLGAPKQEQFMYRLKPYLKSGLMFGVGAIFNFYSGLDDVPKRAPKWVINLGMEWVYRVFSEPKKQIKRVLNIIHDLPIAVNNELKKKKSRQKGKKK